MFLERLLHYLLPLRILDHAIYRAFFRCNAALTLARDPFLLESWNFSTIVGQLTESVESSFLIHQDVYHDLSVCP